MTSHDRSLLHVGCTARSELFRRSILSLWDWVAAEARGASLNMAGKLVSPGESVGQDLPGGAALRDVAAWRDCVRDRRAVADDCHVRVVAAVAQGECRVFGHHTDVAPEPRFVLHRWTLCPARSALLTSSVPAPSSNGGWGEATRQALGRDRCHCGRGGDQRRAYQRPGCTSRSSPILARCAQACVSWPTEAPSLESSSRKFLILQPSNDSVASLPTESTSTTWPCSSVIQQPAPWTEYSMPVRDLPSRGSLGGGPDRTAFIKSSTP